MKLIVGLGNPGKEYEKTRHNTGFMILDQFAKDMGMKFSTKMNGMYAKGKIDGESFILLKPLSYMNLSGIVVKQYVDYYKVKPSDILVIHDDLDLELGKVRIRSKGSSGGHNGIKNIIVHLNSEEFKRIRVGIGKDENISTIDYVLGKFNDEALKVLEENYDRVFGAIDDFINGVDFHKIESKYN